MITVAFTHPIRTSYEYLTDPADPEFIEIHFYQSNSNGFSDFRLFGDYDLSFDYVIKNVAFGTPTTLDDLTQLVNGAAEDILGLSDI
jgi:hypothetical protein